MPKEHYDRLAMGAVIALGVAIVGLSATGTPLNVPQPDKASLSRRTRSSVIVSSSGDTFFRTEAAICASDYLRLDQHPPWASQSRGASAAVRRGFLDYVMPGRSGVPFDAPRHALYGRFMPLPPGFVPPCLPTKAPQPPSGNAWLHEITCTVSRTIARKEGGRVRLTAALATTSRTASP